MKPLLALALLTAGAASAQVVVPPPPVRPATEALGFTIANVVDARSDTTLGQARTGLSNRLQPLVIAGGSIPAVATALRTIAPPAPGAQTLTVAVAMLSLSEQVRGTRKVAETRLLLRFYVARGDSVAPVGAGFGTASQTALDVTRLHSDVLAEALRKAVVSFAATDWRDIPLQFSSGADATQRFELPPSPKAPRGRTAFRYVSAGALVGRNATGAQGQFGIQMLGQSPWWTGSALEAQLLSVENRDEGLGGVFASTGLGLQLNRRLGDSPLNIQIGGGVSFGNEQIGDETRFFGGGRGSLSIAIATRTVGPIASVGVYGSRLFGSRLYPRDVGATLTVGVQY